MVYLVMSDCVVRCVFGVCMSMCLVCLSVPVYVCESACVSVCAYSRSKERFVVGLFLLHSLMCPCVCN